jgi:hypothetical protein
MKGGLPRSVFAHQPYNLARINLKVHLLQRLNAGEVFGNLFHLQ